jgi:hypothetical protein
MGCLALGACSIEQLAGLAMLRTSRVMSPKLTARTGMVLSPPGLAC